jgi:protein TonB
VHLLNTSFSRFLALSVILHGLVFILLSVSTTKGMKASMEPEKILVSLLPPLRETEIRKEPTPQQPARQEKISRTSPSPLAKPAFPVRAEDKKTAHDPAERQTTNVVPAPTIGGTESTVERAPLKSAGISIQTLPGAGADSKESAITKERLAANLRNLTSTERYISLGTTNPRYAPYTKAVKQFIYAKWEYPELALQYGIQGKGTVEIVIASTGQVEMLSLRRSSGSNLLDEELIRAIRAAMPFPPLPRAWNLQRVWIIANFEYYNGQASMNSPP